LSFVFVCVFALVATLSLKSFGTRTLEDSVRLLVAPSFQCLCMLMRMLLRIEFTWKNLTKKYNHN